MGGGWAKYKKKNLCKGKFPKKNSCIDPPNYFPTIFQKKIRAEDFTLQKKSCTANVGKKKTSCELKNPQPPITFLMVRPLVPVSVFYAPCAIKKIAEGNVIKSV